MSEFENFKCYLNQLPATLLKLLGVAPPTDVIAEPVDQIVSKYEGIDRIVINMVDNFGLFEVTYMKPKFMITNSEIMALLSTKNPYTLSMLHQIMYG